MSHFMLVIHTRYTNSGPTSPYPAYEAESQEEADDLLANFPKIYGEVCRELVACAPSTNAADESEGRLRRMECGIV